MRKIFLLPLLFFSLLTFAQNEDKYWAQWDKGYPEVNIIDILNFEKYYADSVEKHPEIVQYFTRFDKYSFRAEFLGRTRKMDTAVLKSMKRVSTLFGGNPSQLDNLTGSEVLFKVENEEIWMAIQPKLLKALKEEIIKGDKPKLYCSYFNEHTSKKKLYNTFLISEFIK